MMAAYGVVTESKNESYFWSLLSMQLILAVFHSQFPKPDNKAQEAYPQSFTKSMSKGVHRSLPSILLATTALTFYAQGDKW